MVKIKTILTRRKILSTAAIIKTTIAVHPSAFISLCLHELYDYGTTQTDSSYKDNKEILSTAQK
jgi:hypothetical protein